MHEAIISLANPVCGNPLILAELIWLAAGIPTAHVVAQTCKPDRALVLPVTWRLGLVAGTMVLAGKYIHMFANASFANPGFGKVVPTAR